MSFDPDGRPVVLIADDERLNRQLVRTFLETAGYQVIECSNGEDALVMARQHHPTLAMLDVRMHGMSGYDVARALKSDPDTAPIKIVILSAHNRPADKAEALAAGADAYLYKLLEWSDIMQRIGELIAESQRS